MRGSKRPFTMQEIEGAVARSVSMPDKPFKFGIIESATGRVVFRARVKRELEGTLKNLNAQAVQS